MKSFLKYILATVIGIFITFFILLLILVVSSTPKSYSLKDDTILYLNLRGSIQDKTNDNPFMQYLGISEIDEFALPDIISAIKKAKENDKIKGIYINAGILSAPNASLLEIRNELLDYKESGKFIVAYSDNYMQSSYFLSSVADKIILNPQGNLDLHGLAATPTFYTGLFDKLGIEMQIFKVGTYKSAVEPYMLDKMSEANKEQVRAYIGDIWSNILSGISDSRNISIDELNQITDNLPLLRDARYIQEKGLVDELMYETEVKQYLANLTNKEKVKDLSFATLENMQDIMLKDANKHKDKIAVLYAEGSIISSSSSENIGDKYYIKQIEKLKDNENIKAVVLRVNSPGGSAYASEQIWKAVTDLKAVKPVVVSMGGYAASGGYYISCNASRIVAQPSTLTGSIGIFGMFPNVEGLTKKVGLTFDSVKTNRFSDFGNITRPMREDEKEILQDYIERGYDLFLTRCADGRGIPKDSLARIAEGRVWTGNQALQIGLVDELGGIQDAVKIAANLANVDHYSVSEYPVKKDFWQELLNTNKDNIAASIVKSYFGEDYKLISTVKEIKEMNEQDFIQARMPFDIEIN